MAEIKPIGFKPDGSHIHKGTLFVVVGVLIGFCAFGAMIYGLVKFYTREK